MREALYGLADDLSGALEIGASLRSRGWKVTVPLTDAAAVAQGGDNEILIFSSETRASGPMSAEEKVTKLLIRQRAIGRRLWFKKVDSTLRGQMAAEIKALYSVLRPPLVVLCPANPDSGRTVRDRQLLVEGTPLHETAFKNDPLQPMLTSDLAEILGEFHVRCAWLSLATLRESVIAQRFLVEAQRQGRSLIVSDAETNADLRQLVYLARLIDPAVVFVGANGLTRALVVELGEPTSYSPEISWPASPAFLAVCGSRHPASHRQLEYFSKNGGRVHELTSLTADPLAQAGDTDLQGATALRFSDSVAARPGRCLEALTTLTVDFAQRCPGATLYLTGGETAAAVCAALHLEKLEVVDEFQSGVVRALGFSKDATPVKLIIKPGGYGRPDLLTNVVRSEFPA